MEIKKPTYKILAKYLSVTEQAVKQYPKNKRELLVFGLWRKLENEISIDNKKGIL